MNDIRVGTAESGQAYGVRKKVNIIIKKPKKSIYLNPKYIVKVSYRQKTPHFRKKVNI